MNHYHQRVAAIRQRYKTELLRKRLWHQETRARYDRFECGGSVLAAYPDQLLFNIYGKAARKLRGIA